MNQRRQTPRAGRGKPQHSGKSASWMGGTDSGQSAPARGGPIRIAVVDDDNAVLQSLTAYLATAPDIKLVGMGTTGFEAVRLATKHHPDILMTDVRMPIMDGISAVEQVRLLAPDVKVVLLTTFDDDEAMLAGLQAGASGFLLKNTSPEDLVGGLRQVAAGGTVVSPGPTGRLVKNYLVPLPPEPSPDIQLSKREMDVLELLCQAYSNAEIAQKLYVQESTVKSHLSSIMSKLQVNSRLKVVVRAYELGLVRS